MLKINENQILLQCLARRKNFIFTVIEVHCSSDFQWFFEKVATSRPGRRTGPKKNRKFVPALIAEKLRRSGDPLSGSRRCLNRSSKSLLDFEIAFIRFLIAHNDRTTLPSRKSLLLTPAHVNSRYFLARTRARRYASEKLRARPLFLPPRTNKRSPLRQDDSLDGRERRIRRACQCGGRSINRWHF